MIAALASVVCPSTAQVAGNRTNAYLVPGDVTDARSLWVNPAGLAVQREASVMLDLTVLQPGARGRLGQVTAGFSSHGLSFGYQRDNFPSGLHGHTYRLGLAGASGGLAAGVALAFFRGATGGTGWDIGARYTWRPLLTLSGVVRNIGQPTVRGVRQDATFVPALTLRPLAARLAVSAQAAFATSAALGYAFQLSGRITGRPRIGFVARLDTDRLWRRTALTFGLSWGGSDRVGLVASTPGDFSSLNSANLYGVASRTAGR